MGIVRAFAKINLTLDVLDRRPDGYHNISTIMQTISLHDIVQVELTKNAGDIRVTVNGPYAGGVPTDERNLVHRAAKALLEQAQDEEHGVVIHISKMIPAQAGLGGGSSDAASTLAELNQLLGRPLQHAELVPIAAKLGSDVPFFVYGGACRVEGVGERVTRMETAFHLAGNVVKPPTGVSTAMAYAALDDLRGGNFSRSPSDGKTLSNDFEQVVYAIYPEIMAVRDALIESGCSNAILCGSGSAVFGICDQQNANDILKKVQSTAIGDCFLVRTVPYS